MKDTTNKIIVHSTDGSSIEFFGVDMRLDKDFVYFYHKDADCIIPVTNIHNIEVQHPQVHKKRKIGF